MIKLVLLIPLMPALGALINGVFGGWAYEKKTAHRIACGAVFISLLTAAALFFWLLGMTPEERVTESIIQYDLADFIPGGIFRTANETVSNFNIKWSFQFDPLSCVMALIVCGVGFLIHVYSIGYMAHEEGYWRFFSYLNLFMFSMLTLVLAGNFLVMFLGWEGVGLCSYLLIGFYFTEAWPADASKKAFITNRVGDFAMILGMGTMFVAFGTLDFSVMGERIAHFAHGGDLLLWGSYHISPAALFTVIGLLILFAATAKSAQIPLYVWLPDAMAGPTPVSALIHAATMVTAGIYIIVRMNILYQNAPAAMIAVAVVGAVTALFAASMGLLQDDMKKILAYSTISQLGYMMLALGVGAFTAGIFHLMTHAFFKALLFLGAGSVIHALSGEQSIWKAGTLRKYIPGTHLTFAVATFTIAGFPPLSGFFSKDEILWNTLNASYPYESLAWLPKILWAAGIIAAMMTAFYMFRLYFVTFWGKDRMDAEVRSHVHESPSSMLIPLTILAGLAAVGGGFGLPFIPKRFHLLHSFLRPNIAAVEHAGAHHGHHSLVMEGVFMIISVAVALAGFLWAMAWYKRGNDEKPKKWAEKFSGLYKVVKNKYYVDELYRYTVILGTYYFGKILWLFDKWIIDGLLVNGIAFFTKFDAYFSAALDKYIVDGLVNFNAWVTRKSSGIFRKIQTGMVQSYALIFLLGVFAVMCVYLVVISL